MAHLVIFMSQAVTMEQTDITIEISVATGQDDLDHSGQIGHLLSTSLGYSDLTKTTV